MKDDVKPTISVMMWGCIWKGGRSDLVVMERDPNAKRNGYTANSYLKVLRETLLPLYDGTRDFQHDNAPIHGAQAVQTFVLNNQISLMDWPPRSPDLNPIENVWKLLKGEIHKRYPNLWELTRNGANIEYFKQCVKTAWRAIDQVKIDNIIASLERRIAAVIKAHGSYTGY